MCAAFIPAPNTASVELIFTLNGQTCENVLHVQKSAPYDLAALQALRTLVQSWDNTSFRTIRGAGAVLVRIRTKALDTDSSPMEDYTLPSGQNGSFPGGGAQTNNVTFAVKLATGFSGRSARGRIYIVGVPAGAIAGVDVTSTWAAQVVASVGTLISNLAAASGQQLVVCSKFHNGTARPVAVNYVVTGAVAVDLHLDSMRRRLAGRGRA
jgi:hypothetical protein